MQAHGFKTVSDAVRSLQSTGAELLARHLSKASPVEETRSYLLRLQIESLIPKLNIVHIAGTKGKGSVAAFTESILRHAPLDRPLRTGLFTSPHLRDVTERIRVGGRSLPPEEFETRFWHVFNRLHETKEDCGDSPPMPGFFRFFTVLAFDVFLAYDVDVAVFEVGIGGLLDPTNVIPSPIACGITSIGYDHCDVLGDTLEAIAFQKAGIIKSGCEAVTCFQPNKSVLAVIQSKTEQEKVPLHIVSPLEASSVQLGIGGKHQCQNAAIALRLAQIVLRRLPENGIPDDLLKVPEIRAGLRDCSWPGRCQKLEVASNLVLYIDGAHTIESCAASGAWFQQNILTDNSLNILVFNCALGRDPIALLSSLNLDKTPIDYVFSCPFNQERPHLYQQLPILSDFDRDATGFPEPTSWQETILQAWTYICRSHSYRPPVHTKIFPSVRNVIADLLQLASEKPESRFQVLITGSLYLVGDTLEAVKYPVR